MFRTLLKPNGLKSKISINSKFSAQNGRLITTNSAPEPKNNAKNEAAIHPAAGKVIDGEAIGKGRAKLGTETEKTMRVYVLMGLAGLAAVYVGFGMATPKKTPSAGTLGEAAIGENTPDFLRDSKAAGSAHLDIMSKSNESARRAN